MVNKMDISLSGEVFTDEPHSDVGSAAFRLNHDWFIDLSINTASGGGGTELVLGTDYDLSVEALDLSERVTDELGTSKNVWGKVQIINATYQTGDLYFSGKYIADSVEAEDTSKLLTVANMTHQLGMRAIPFTPIPWNKSLFALVTTAIDGDGTAADDAGTAFQLNDADGTDWTTVATAGDIAYNSTKNLFATVLSVAAHSLWLDADIFDSGDVYYLYSEPSVPSNCIELTGALIDGDFSKTADSNTTNHLTDADGTDWTTVVSEGDWALNVTDGKLARVTGVAAHDLTLDWDAFPDGNEVYALYSYTIDVSDSESLLDGKTIYEMNITGRFLRAGRTASIAGLDAMQGHLQADHNYEDWTGTAGGTVCLAHTAADRSGAYHRDTANITSDGIHGSPRTAEETRPRNLSMVYIMRIK
jgi:hypothetical protein